jgi:hypothetical protein
MMWPLPLVQKCTGKRGRHSFIALAAGKQMPGRARPETKGEGGEGGGETKEGRKGGYAHTTEVRGKAPKTTKTGSFTG